MTETETRVAFALREEYAGTVLQRETEDDPGTEVPVFTGGLIGAGDRELNVRELLDEGNGTIVIEPAEHPLTLVALDEYPALKRVPVPADAPVTTGYADQTATKLREEAGRRGIAGAAGASKVDLVPALEADDERIAAGDAQPDDYSVSGLIAGANAEPQEA
jgi:hypothetical protein